MFFSDMQSRVTAVKTLVESVKATVEGIAADPALDQATMVTNIVNGVLGAIAVNLPPEDVTAIATAVANEIKNRLAA
jgi:hypothetical protein